jgi:hypothetical protein
MQVAVPVLVPAGGTTVTVSSPGGEEGGIAVGATRVAAG